MIGKQPTCVNCRYSGGKDKKSGHVKCRREYVMGGPMVEMPKAPRKCTKYKEKESDTGGYRSRKADALGCVTLW